MPAGPSSRSAMETELNKLSSPRIFLVRMLVFLVLCTLLMVVLYKQIMAAFFANPGLNALIGAVLLIGIILSFLLLVLTGIVVRNLFGGQIVKGFENLVRRIPVIGSVYGGAKTFSETVLTDKGKSFKQVVMVEFPRKGIFSVGFITSEELEEVQAKTEQDVVCVFVPTTPNPTTGFIVLVPRDEVVRLDMTVDEAVKMLLTLGVVVPKWNNKPVVADLAPQQPPP